jgi:hypothetical protein
MILAERYAELRRHSSVRERSLLVARRAFGELELQARWFAGDFGKQFVTTAGHDVRIVQFGTWNRAAGPDFCDAAISIDRGKPMRGSIEFDLADRNWERHGHAANPDFENTVLHVFADAGERVFFTRTLRNRNVPQVRVDPTALPDASFSDGALARPGRCQAPLRDLPPEKVTSILDAAAQFRLQRKATRLQRIAETHGNDEALFQEIAGALGYKENKLPFTLLAQRAPLHAAPRHQRDLEALLFGLAGFLAMSDLGEFDGGTRQYLRDLWDCWWPRRAEMERLVLPAKAWRFSGTRPLNHPQRRVAALAAIATAWLQFAHSLGERDVPAMRAFFTGLAHPYWDFHYTLTSNASPKPMALVGETRIAEIMANVIYPFLYRDDRNVWPDYEKLPARLSNRRIETAAARLFADADRQRLYLKTVAHQQGLLQIYEDFCLQDNTDCEQCPFPEQMRKWT